jgi:hypothetical protein
MEETYSPKDLLKYGRADHGMVAKNDNLYIIGGSADQIIIWPHIDSI